MSVTVSSYKISDPEYFHREYKNDLPQDNSGNYYSDQCRRVTLVALPFLSLYKPLSFPLAVTLGGLRSVTSLSQFLNEIQNGGVKESSYAFLQTVLAVIALSGTLFAHPLGMLITTVHDCALDSFAIGNSLLIGDLQSALSGSATLLNNTLYLALFLHGGVEIVIASLAMQALMGASYAYAEYQKENYLEAGGHLLMGMVRSNQMLEKFEIFHAKFRAKNNCDETKSVESKSISAKQNGEKTKIEFAGLNAKGSEREILYEECRKLRELALSHANGCNSHLIGLYITQYLNSVNTPTASQLLDELKGKKFSM